MQTVRKELAKFVKPNDPKLSNGPAMMKLASMVYNDNNKNLENALKEVKKMSRETVENRYSKIVIKKKEKKPKKSKKAENSDSE